MACARHFTTSTSTFTSSADFLWFEDASNGSADVASGWQVRRLAETDPMTRLRRLMAKQQFAEGRGSFAEKFLLDATALYNTPTRLCIMWLSCVDIERGRQCLGSICRVPTQGNHIIHMLRSIHVVKSCSRDHVILVITSSRLANGTHFNADRQFRQT